MTTVVVEITSSLLGQVTCFISTRTSWRNSRVSATVPLTRSPMPAAAPVIALLLDSPFFTFTAWLLIKPSSYPGALTPSFRFRRRLVWRRNRALIGRQTLAGEEGFEP